MRTNLSGSYWLMNDHTELLFATASQASTHLRDATLHLHLRVEKSLKWEQFFASRYAYLDFLARYRQLIEPAAQLVVAQLPKASPSGLIASMAEWIARDIGDLHAQLRGDSSPRTSITWLSPEPARIDWVTHPAEAAGIVYVLVGSLNGGKFLANQARRQLQFANKQGLAFFTASGIDVGSQWRATKDWLDRFLATPAAIAQATYSAQQMFLVIENHLGAGQEW